MNDPSVYERTEEDFEGFWEGFARELHWFEEWEKVLDRNTPYAEWFVGGKTAIPWVGDEPGDSRTLTYSELKAEVCRFANALKGLGVEKGDRVAIYLGMVPELPVAMLACARIGAAHSVVFGGFSAQSLRDRINHAEAKIL